MSSITTYSLTVTAGPAMVGKEFTLTGSASFTLWRSSSNPLSVPDPMLSREHCRFDIEADALWVVDLDSANQTFVNDKPVKSLRLRKGDIITVGDTSLRVNSAETKASADNDYAAPVIDLGLGNTQNDHPQRHSMRPVLYAVAALVLLLLAATLILTKKDDSTPTATITSLEAPPDRTLQIIYEKIEATPDSIFRYELNLSPTGLLEVRIDDLSQNRTIRKDKEVDPEILRDWSRIVTASGFFDLSDNYIAPAAGNTLNSWDLTIVHGRQAHQVRVENRPEPDNFAALRERLETFGQSELGIWAIQYSVEKLTDLAHDALLVAMKRMDERDLRYGNIALSIASFRDAEVCLETVEPKPDFYPNILAGMKDAESELDRRHKEYRFLADRAINLQNWEDAANQLKVICDLIPDRTDERHKEAAGKLLDVERRLKASRKTTKPARR
ncbi:MAG: FHA domain-containing protein [Lentisphaerae bacterium]|nr:FHA domain-containing protein [Lentisphaerota bacterium]